MDIHGFRSEKLKSCQKCAVLLDGIRAFRRRNSEGKMRQRTQRRVDRGVAFLFATNPHVDPRKTKSASIRCNYGTRIILMEKGGGLGLGCPFE
jgi:hypothetical protein